MSDLPTRKKIMKIISGKRRETTEKLGSIDQMFLSCPPGSRSLATALIIITKMATLFHLSGAGIWHAGECGERATGDNNIPHILKPCCYRLTGECKMTTHQHCTFLGGYYHVDGPEHCSKVSLIGRHIGGMGRSGRGETKRCFFRVKGSKSSNHIARLTGECKIAK